MRTRNLLLAALVAALGATATTLDENFRDVPVADRPWCYWWWINGHVDKETITSDMEAMRRVGFGGLLMFDARGYHDDVRHVAMPVPAMEFMSPEWRGMLKFGIQEAARVGLEVSVNLSSCAGALKGPWAVGADAPKRLVCQTAPLTGGAKVDAVLKNPELKFFWHIATYAVKYSGTVIGGKEEWINAGDGLYSMVAKQWGKRVDGQKEVPPHLAQEIVELTERIDARGRLVWDVPPGQWALVRFGYTTIEGHEYDVDVLDPVAVEGHFNRMGKAILADAGPLAGKALTHFYSVSWEGAVPMWTGAFEKDFAKYRGYAIRPWMPVLAGFVIKDEAASNDFVTDYRRARNESFRDNFYGTMMALCHRQGIQWHSESGGPWQRHPAVFGEADQLSFLSRNDMPQGEFWYTGASDRRGRQMSRPQAMTAHIYGKRLAAAEAFTHMVRHWTPYPALLKRSGDESFIDGVNQLVWHTFTCSPKEFGTPGSEYFAGTHINPKVTWFEQAAPFMTYLGRCQHLLRQGLFVADVCAYVGDVPYQHWGRHTTNWTEKATLALPSGHGYDILTTEALLERAAVKDGDIVLPDGMTYRVLAVDLDTDQISAAALGKIAALKKAGASVVFGARRPSRTPGLAAGDDEVRRLGGELWDAAGGTASTPSAAGGTASTPSAAGGTASTPSAAGVEPRPPEVATRLAAALKAKGLLPDFEGPFEYTHRRDGETEIYFVAGTGKAECAFRVSGKRPELWDPVSGKVETEAGSRKSEDGRTLVTLDLPQDGSLFVVFRKPSELSGVGRRESGVASPERLALAGSWEVRFQAGRGAPEKAVFATLTDWTTHADPEIKYFSGTATYRKTFEMTAKQAGRKAVLQLGTVAALAQVRLNGKDLGIVWTAPWQAELAGALKAGKNELEIGVTNPWANRLVGDAGLPPERRITKSNMQYEKGKRTLKAFQGFASEDDLQPSGLMGPVTVELY